jgi:O-antigen biosynthesis protein
MRAERGPASTGQPKVSAHEWTLEATLSGSAGTDTRAGPHSRVEAPQNGAGSEAAQTPLEAEEGRRESRLRTPPAADERIRIDGKLFAAGAERFEFRGVTYGTFAPRGDGAPFPEAAQIQDDFAAMREVGFSVVRTYTVPTDDMLEAARDHGLRILAGVFYPDWRYLLGGSRRQQRQVAREAANEVRAAARRLVGCEQVLGLSLGNEVPADVLRWYGSDVIAGALRGLVDVVRAEDSEQLVTYANYPTAEYLPLESLDFLMFNVFLERRADFRRYLTRLHNIAGDRPLVLGEVGLSADPEGGGEHRQAEVLDWQLETAIERGTAGTCVFSWTDEWWVGDAPVEGWHFGLTRADRSPRRSIEVATRWNQRTVRDLDFDWPRISVVICAHNAEATLDECLSHTCALDYPGLEVIVVDDGSRDATPEIAARHPKARLLQLEHGGLAVARNEGARVARGELVAYLDADAYPTPEWPYYLALGLDAPNVGGVGGPNLPPPDDPPGTQVVARSPGGPVHVLTSDDRAEHVPGCNMAFWKLVLEEVGGFDPVYTAAGDDVDVCWRTLNRDWRIGFHPAAVVWHHRRPGLRAYLRQQRTYGRSEALVEARHPERFTPAGTARWRGRIYDSLTPTVARQRIYRGAYGTAAYQSVYHGGGHALDLLHQVGVPIAAALLLTAPLALLSAWLALPAAVALAGLVALALFDVAGADPPRGLRKGRLRFRIMVAAHHLAQPLVRYLARNRHRTVAMRTLSSSQSLPAAVKRIPGGIVVVPEDRPRAELATALVDALRRRGIRASHPSAWDDCDARLLVSSFLNGELQTSSHPEGFVQVRIRARVRRRGVLAALLGGLGAAVIDPVLAVTILVPAASIARGAVRARRLPAQILDGESAR